MAVLLKCPECEQKFRWKFGEESRWPSHCPLCHEDMSIDRADDDIVMPAILSPRTASIDRVKQDIVAGSERRAEIAAEMAGVPVSDMSALKITNLNDRRDADIAAMPVNNIVTQHMDAMSQRGTNMGFASNGVALASSVASGSVTVDGKTVTGIAPRAGATAVGNVQRLIGRG